MPLYWLPINTHWIGCEVLLFIWGYHLWNSQGSSCFDTRSGRQHPSLYTHAKPQHSSIHKRAHKVPSSKLLLFFTTGLYLQVTCSYFNKSMYSHEKILNSNTWFLLWRIIPFTIIWSIWREKNKRIFIGSSFSVAVLVT